MSIVAVHGPNTMGASGAGGAGTGETINSTPTGGGTVTADMANGMRFTFAGAGDRAVADYDWTFTGETAQPNIKSGTVTFSSGGAKTITLTLGSSGGTTPAPGAYTFNVTATATAMPRSMPPGGGDEPPPEEEEGPYDPGEHTVADVVEYAQAHPDEIDEILESEEANKNRSTLIAQLEALLEA